MEIRNEGLTSTVGGGRSRDFAGGGEGHGLGDVQNDAELGAALEGLTETCGVGLEHSLESSAASPFRLLRLAVVGDERQAVRHVQDQRRAVHRRRRSARGGVGVAEAPDGEKDQQSEGKGEESGKCHFQRKGLEEMQNMKYGGLWWESRALELGWLFYIDKGRDGNEVEIEVPLVS